MICPYCDCEIEDRASHKIPGSCLDLLKKERASLQRQKSALEEEVLRWKGKTDRPKTD